MWEATRVSSGGRAWGWPSLPDGSDREAVKASVEAALGGEAAVLWLTDDKGREIAVASSRLTHVEMGPPGSNPIGFG